MAEIASISPSLFESAKIDGASEIQIDRYVVLPLLRNIIGTATILTATGMIQQFDMIYMTSRGGPGVSTMNLSYFLYRTASLENNTGLASATGVIQLMLGVVVICRSAKFIVWENGYLRGCRNMSRYVDRTAMYIVMIIATVISLYPFVWLLESTFKTQYELLNSGMKLPNISILRIISLHSKPRRFFFSFATVFW